MMNKLITLLPLGLFAGAVSLQGQITIANFNFSDAPNLGPDVVAATSSNAETVAPGLGSAIATVSSSTGGFATLTSGDSVAQESGDNNDIFGPNWFQFEVDFGSVSTSEITFDQLVLNGRTGVAWNTDGTLGGYQSNRRSEIQVAWAPVTGGALGTFTDIGSVVSPSFDNTSDAWNTDPTVIDLTSLLLAGTEEGIAFRVFTRTNQTGENWHRTQMNSAELVGAVPEPSTYAALLGVLALGFVAWRRRR